MTAKKTTPVVEEVVDPATLRGPERMMFMRFGPDWRNNPDAQAHPLYNHFVPVGTVGSKEIKPAKE
jgi:hypothetical protein